MLKPQRKIIRKEIKRDPFLETIDKIEYNFEQNRKTYLYIALGLIAVIISGNFLLNKQSQKDIDSNSALGIALVAFDNEDYENAKFQFETILSDFSGTNSSNIANYYLGKISFENNDLTKAESYLNEYLNNSEPDILIPGTIKILSNIALKNNEFDKAIKLLDRGLRLGLDNNISNEFKLLKVSILIEQDKIEISQNILNEILLEKKLPIHLKQRSEELIGMM
ncbi:MAG: tetratricopeptide repeat protein [Candidatus Neomarinimicrobiota bacterium]|nr:tetratricopeptide repeat protein [Candidatus Neomarinimicrobiota bacterium]|tara:strand:- start:298 stop:966 length:669 start_codon:yes stop_codon:yes gene_type:complete